MTSYYSLKGEVTEWYPHHKKNPHLFYIRLFLGKCWPPLTRIVKSYTWHTGKYFYISLWSCHQVRLASRRNTIQSTVFKDIFFFVDSYGITFRECPNAETLFFYKWKAIWRVYSKDTQCNQTANLPPTLMLKSCLCCIHVVLFCSPYRTHIRRTLCLVQPGFFTCHICSYTPSLTK